MMEDRVGYIRITNGNTGVVKGRYSGKDYLFKPNVPLDVPEIVARHVFGFGMDDKSAALNRLGWALVSEDLDKGMEMLGNVAFDDPPEMIEAPKSAKGKKKALPAPRAAVSAGPDDEDEDDEDDDDETGTAGPPVASGGTKGGGFNSPPNGPKIGQSGEPEGDDDKF